MPRLPYLPALDGLRAIAVAAVVAYHAGLALYGGFLGVETFFVLSGFLITALLLAERQSTGAIDLAAFWRRRVLRLLPALVLLLAATMTAATMFIPRESAGISGDVLAALGFVTNWHLIMSERSYFDATLRQPLLQHLWSLAVEEQFYLLWPLLFSRGMRLLGARGVLIATIVSAGASTMLMARLYEPGVDPSRLYYGTDTRASGLLLGASLAMIWVPGNPPAPQSRRFGNLLDLLGLIALVGLVMAYVILFASHPLLYRGGFAIVALVTCLVLAAATHPQTRVLPALLSWAPLRWIGQRSYGIYLWHWPVFALSRPGVDISVSGWGFEVLRVGLVIGLAALSYRLVEMPIRRGALGNLLPALRTIGTLPIVVARNLNLSGSLANLSLPIGLWLILSALILLSTTLHTAFSATLLGAATVPAEVRTPAQTQPALSPRSVAAASPTASSGDVLQPEAANHKASAPMTSSATTPVPVTDADAEKLKPLASSLTEELQRIIDVTVTDENIPGAVVAVRVPGSAPWISSAGLADHESGELMTPDTQVRIGSVSKMFTAVVVLQLIEEGRIALDDTVAQWLPGLVPSGEQITVRYLLQHRSGLYDYLEDRRFVTTSYQEPDRLWAPAELVAYAADFPLAFTPGADGAWDYSSTNYVILGMLVEKATGNSLADETRRRIFEPLGLKRTVFTPEVTVVGPMASGYAQHVNQSKVPMSFVIGTASIVSTSGDLLRFAAALFDGELLEPQTMKQFLEFVDGKGQYNMPELEYGLGVMRNQLPVGPDAAGSERGVELATTLGHIGGYGGFRSALWYNSETGIIVALGVNQASTDPNELATALFNATLTGIGR